MTALFALHGADLPTRAFQASATFVDEMERAGTLPKALRGLVLSALSWAPTERPESVQALGQGLRAALPTVSERTIVLPSEAPSVPAYRPKALRRTSRSMRTIGLLSALLGLAIAVSATLAGVLQRGYQKKQQAHRVQSR